MDNIVIVGSSGHARVVIDIVEQERKLNIVGLIDRFRDVGEQTFGYTILGKEEELPQLVEEHCLEGVIVAIGDNFVRSLVVNRVSELCPQLEYKCALHPKAVVASGVSIGAGTVVMAGAVVNPGCSVGRFCILNTASSLDHDSVMGDFASLAPGVVTGGKCHIGSHSAIGIGAFLSNGVCIGEHTVIGAASLVLKPIGDLVVAYGVPARAIRCRRPGDIYLSNRD